MSALTNMKLSAQAAISGLFARSGATDPAVSWSEGMGTQGEVCLLPEADTAYECQVQLGELGSTCELTVNSGATTLSETVTLANGFNAPSVVGDPTLTSEGLAIATIEQVQAIRVSCISGSIDLVLDAATITLTAGGVFQASTPSGDLAPDATTITLTERSANSLVSVMVMGNAGSVG